MVYLDKPTDFSAKFEIVSCFVEQQGKFLLLLRQDTKPQGNTWGVPAGKVAEGETAEAAMERELREETQIDSDSQLQLVRTVYVRYPEYDFVYHIYTLDFTGSNQVEIDPVSHKDYAWVTPKEALGAKLIPDLGTCVKLYYLS